jgi:WD40 repeat protein
MRFIFSLLVTSSLASAQYASLEGPSSGLFYDQPFKAIRTILGVPGSATFGPAVIDGVTFASVAPVGKLALVRKPGEGFSLLRMTASMTLEPITDCLEDVDRVTWAQDASSAVLISPTAGRMQRIHFKASGTEREEATDLSLPAGEVTALAVDSDAKNIVVGVRSSESGGVYLLQQSRAAVRVLAMDDPAAMVFDRSGHRLFVVDRQSRTIFELRNFGVAPEVIPFALEPERNPVSLALSSNGRQLFMTASAPSTLLVFDTETHQKLTETELMVEPLELSGLSENAIFLLRNRTQVEEPLWILDTRRLQPQVYFVPPGEVRE